MSRIKSKLEFQAIILGFMLAVSLIAVIIIASCKENRVDQDNFTYHTVEIQGMTCVQWGSPISYKGGLTCNWDEWKGEAR